MTDSGWGKFAGHYTSKKRSKKRLGHPWPKINGAAHSLQELLGWPKTPEYEVNGIPFQPGEDSPVAKFLNVILKGLEKYVVQLENEERQARSRNFKAALATLTTSDIVGITPSVLEHQIVPVEALSRIERLSQATPRAAWDRLTRATASPPWEQSSDQVASSKQRKSRLDSRDYDENFPIPRKDVSLDPLYVTHPSPTLHVDGEPCWFWYGKPEMIDSDHGPFAHARPR